MTRELESYTFVLYVGRLMRRSSPRKSSIASKRAIWHSSTAMRERGAMLASGPFDKQPDESLRGFSIYRTSIEETRELLRDDPALKANRMAADVFTWWTAKGSVAFPLASAASESS